MYYVIKGNKGNNSTTEFLAGIKADKTRNTDNVKLLYSTFKAEALHFYDQGEAERIISACAVFGIELSLLFDGASFSLNALQTQVSSDD